MKASSNPDKKKARWLQAGSCNKLGRQYKLMTAYQVKIYAIHKVQVDAINNKRN